MKTTELCDGITLVTAFFPIGRGQWSGESRRSDDKYFTYFAHWARIRNDLIVYTTPENEVRVRAIRASYGRENTIIHTVPRLSDIDVDLFKLMHQVGERFPEFSLYPDKPEVNNPTYDFAMYAKFWCLAQASSEVSTNKMAWIDFGFDHGGEYYKDSYWFDREWNYHRPSGNVSLFQLREFPTDPIFDCVRRTDTYIQGNCIELDTIYARQFHKDVRNQYEHLLRCGLLDDDQIVLLMCHLEKPNEYCCLPSTWFSMFKDYNDEDKIPETEESKTLLPEFMVTGARTRWYWTKRCLRFVKKDFWHLVRRYPL
ncbi:WlaTC/HtrL family glycosyltransferase [Bifidobacterium olomucense]|uniref:HtrL family protein n=1 Tax=Bifidobacterium olomucense TaxID=2675324 RepID=A0A7Y0EZJ3_9BIFI|nr:WlaTC/HtrL family glycosyltransferase [Bifidobacterium sp. DSM 109959]NMM99264.1 hypothetical protein [Bifidobacterium sp. DSM 109959]